MQKESLYDKLLTGMYGSGEPKLKWNLTMKLSLVRGMETLLKKQSEVSMSVSEDNQRNSLNARFMLIH